MTTTEVADEREQLLALLRELSHQRQGVVAELVGLDGRKWDAMVRLRELGVPLSRIAEAWGVTVPAVIHALAKPRPDGSVGR